ncbi:MAG: ABC transporter permease, partial [Firmicutes bacterium]|nr:ABC transporter permease [Bacillota bacterium]
MKARIAAAPYLLWAALFIIVPMGLVGWYAITDMDGNLTLDNFTQGMRFAPVIGTSVWLAIIATVICLIIAYPLAYMISRKSGNGQRTMLLLVMLPMWMNFLLRTYAWMTLLENNGVINRLLGMIGLGPFEMINTPGAVVLGMVYNYLPFMILPLYSVMTKIEPLLIEAATDLGCSPWETLKRVTLPLSLP